MRVQRTCSSPSA